VDGADGAGINRGLRTEAISQVGTEDHSRLVQRAALLECAGATLAVALHLYSGGENRAGIAITNNGETKVLSPTLVKKVWDDFAP
jgi:hypothetical protein